LSISNTIMGR